MKNQLANLGADLPAWIWNITVLFTAVLVGFILKFIVTTLLKRYKDISDYSLLKSTLTHLGRPLNHFIPLLILNLLIPAMRLQELYLAPLNRIAEMLLIISFASVLINSIKVFEDFVYFNYDLSKTDNLKERKIRTQLQFIRKVLTVFIVLITVAIILLSFDNVRKIGAGLLTGVGIGGIIIGFAAQQSLGNLLAGFQIAFTQPIRIDDVLVVEGEWGRVEEITLTYVVLNIWDQRRLILPINYFIQKPFQNWTRTTAEILGSVFIYADYSLPVDSLREEFTRILSNEPLWDKRVKALQITDAKESTMEIRMLVSARNSSEAFDLRCIVREKLIKFIRDNNPESLPQKRLILKDLDHFKPDFTDIKPTEKPA